jgi:ankyrin repeat protein
MSDFEATLTSPLGYLQEYARRGDLDGVQEVLEEYPEIKDELSSAGTTALQAAVHAGHMDIVDCLLNAKADVNAKSNRGDTALHMAAAHNIVDMALRLVKAGAESDIVNNDGDTAESLATTPEVRMAVRGVDPAGKGAVVMASDDEDSD